VADSDKSALDRTFDRVEINSALAGSVTSDVRYSQTLSQDLRYVAAPIVQNYEVVAAVRLSMPETQVDNEIRETQVWLLVFVGAVVIAAALVAWLLARSITAPLLGVAAIARALPDDLTLRASETDGPEEVRAVGHALNETAEKLNGIVHRTQRVAADASHHLRTPLTGVRLRLEAIEDISTESAVQDQAQAATAEVDRLTRSIDQVLALARSDAGNIDEHVVDISEIVRSRVEAATYLADERGISLNIEVSDGVQILAGPGIVARVIDELLGNAMSYAKSIITVSVGVEGGLAKLVVADDGPGVTAQEYESIFERFVRGTSSVVGGSGLGLALVREAARAHGGDAIAEPDAKGGLRVIVTWKCWLSRQNST
jgi:signal transduction histidine kinase